MRDWAAHLLGSRTGRTSAHGIAVSPSSACPASRRSGRGWAAGGDGLWPGAAGLGTVRLPGLLTAEADELIAGQYCGRPQLRPVFDAVLAALPAVSLATVQARKTMVSLVTPRRTFAVIQASAKRRVDLGLWPEHERPGGRLLAARVSAQPPCGSP
jgi:hypothetical protein